MYIYIYICIYILYIYMYTHMYVRIYIYICDKSVCTYICIWEDISFPSYHFLVWLYFSARNLRWQGLRSLRGEAYNTIQYNAIHMEYGYDLYPYAIFYIPYPIFTHMICLYGFYVGYVEHGNPTAPCAGWGKTKSTKLVQSSIQINHTIWLRCLTIALYGF